MMADEAAGVLVAYGGLGCAVREPFRAAPTKSGWVKLDGFFEKPCRSQLRNALALLRRCQMVSANGADVEVKTIRDFPASRWMRQFKPLTVGRRLLIVPPWSKASSGRRLRLVIKPGRAFGTGHHPTTCGVLRMVEAEMERRKIDQLLDVGTGSGIIALAARILGAKYVAGIDSDPVAVEEAYENAALNKIDEGVRFSSARLSGIRRKFDLIAANIFASTLIDLAPMLPARLGRDGRLILSGIQPREARKVLKGYPALRCLRMRRERGWVTMLLARRYE